MPKALATYIAKRSQDNAMPPVILTGVHAEIRQIAAEIEARWNARKGITLEQERATQEEHDATIAALETKLQQLGDRLPAERPSLEDAFAIAHVARNWQNAPGRILDAAEVAIDSESYSEREIWDCRLIRAVLQLEASQAVAPDAATAAAQRVSDLINSKPRSPTIAEVAAAIGSAREPVGSQLLERFNAAQAECVRAYTELDSYHRRIEGRGGKVDERHPEHVALDRTRARSDDLQTGAIRAIWASKPQSRADLMAFLGAAVECWDEIAAFADPSIGAPVHRARLPMAVVELGAQLFEPVSGAAFSGHELGGIAGSVSVPPRFPPCLTCVC